MLADGGSSDVVMHTLEHDPVNAYYVVRPWGRDGPPPISPRVKSVGGDDRSPRLRRGSRVSEDIEPVEG